VVGQGLAGRVEVEVAYAIGRPDPVALHVDAVGTGGHDVDFRPAAIIERLGLKRPIYAATRNYGHFGWVGVPWEG
jgi:S-adenosylmethionine synthetase